MKFTIVMLVACVGTFSLSGNALALDGKNLEGTCKSYVKASSSDLADFNKNPAGLLGSNRMGGLQLTSLVKSLVLADVSSVEKLLKLLEMASPQQVSALGSGIGLAAKAFNNSCEETDKKRAKAVVAQIALSGNEQLLTAFNSAANGTAPPWVDATDANSPGVGGPAGGAANVGALGTLSTSNSPSPTSSSVQNSTQTISLSGANTICKTSVSPTRTC